VAFVLLSNLAQVYIYLGRVKYAKEAALEVLRIDPEFSVEKWCDVNSIYDPEWRRDYSETLHKAGLK
jgi:hypothetical protein